MERIADVEKVLMNEIDNQHGVYLYLEGDSWCAYERSAYYLARLNVPVILQKEVIREGYDVLAQTTDMNPVLKKAGVVDAGGKGYLVKGGG